MIQVRMLKTFNTRYGFRRTGETFWSEKDYVDSLKPGMVEIIRSDDGAPIKPSLQPSNRQAFPGAPHTKGKEPATNPPPSQLEPSAEVPIDGAAKPSRLSRVARRSRRPMPNGAEPDAK